MHPKYKKMLASMAEKSPDGKTGGAWSLYILRCGDGTLYTGITNDVQKRLQAHSRGRGARYTRTRCPVELLYQEECGSRAAALVRECAVKSLSRQQKEKLLVSE